MTIQKKYILPIIASGLFFIGTAFKDNFFEIAKQIEIFTELYKTLHLNYVDDVNPAELMDKSIKNMLSDLDPYTNFYNEQDVIKARISQAGAYTSIGAITERSDGKLLVKEVFKNYPSDKAGLKPGDVIVQIGDVNVSEFKNDVSQLLQGSKNTKLQIKYLRQGIIQSTSITLDEIPIKAVPYYTTMNQKIGYIVLSAFNEKTTLETKHALEELKKKGVEKIILDLRGNPGGLLNEAVNICNLFVPKNEIIVTTKSKIEQYNTVYKTDKEPIDTEIPLAILVDGKSASASEIVSGALQDLDRAVVIGCRSFGKGLVQRYFETPYGTQCKITISRYYTPSGRCIQALDYLHKDENGKAIRTEAKNYTAFKTKKGRTVYDGGGILPDIELSESKRSTIGELLLKNNGVFDFATQYYYQHQNIGNAMPEITSKDFEDFKQFLKKSNFNFDTESEKALKKTLEAAQKEHIETAIKPAYQQLYQAIQKSQEQLLEDNKEEIKKLLQDEIIKRYYYSEGLYEYYSQNNVEIKKAMDILTNLEAYNRILKK